MCFQILLLKSQVKYNLGGRLFIDGGSFIASPNNFNSGISITDLRLTGKVALEDDWSVKLDVGFAYNNVSLKDAFIQKINGHKHLFRLGYMIGMFSLDQSSSTNDYLFLTGANVAETFYPGRRIGIAYTYFSPCYYISVGAFCGDGLNFQKTIKQGFNFTLRGVYRPIIKDDKLLHFGIGGLFRHPDRNIETNERTVVFRSRGVTYQNVPYILDECIKDVNTEFQYNIEMIGHCGKFFFQAEYLQMYINSMIGIKYKAKGGYAEGGLFLLGKNFKYDVMDAMQICPNEVNSLALFGRFSYTDLDDIVWKGGNQYDVSLGMNYYLNKNIIFRINYSYLWTNKNAAVPSETWNMLQTRVQIKF